ncbi:hypothetical protein N7478_012382 [Penicillium angulare]|uniref:uncharacterized protein n=1 Tax=Penicillium angulare TaxID=116970 RepID=UPI0025424180|nr:uncharacterized protein N7478_012382 [Penicillium angulare]KAJ5259401.1 hypothetical protein N7478_012382 [Penicillium angulare]
MKFLISTNVEKFRSVLGDHDASQVSFCQHDTAIAEQINGLYTINVWICEGSEVTEELLDQWLDRNRNSPKALLVHDTTLIPQLEKLFKGRAAKIQAISKQDDCDSSWVTSTLREAEMVYARGCARGASQSKESLPKKTVLLVGAGIMNLVAAEFLATQGFKVRVVDASPDPRTCNDWTRQGVTHGGGDARMFTYTEADSYNERSSSIYRGMRHVFRKTTLNGGWSVKSPLSFNAAEIAWVNTFEQTPTWLAQAMKEDIYYVNSEAGKLWEEFMSRSPELFEGVLLHGDILRLYAEDIALNGAHEVNRALGAVIDEFSLKKLLIEWPVFDAAAKSSHLAGGLTVKGFTLGIHSFVNKLIDRIIELDGEFIWDCRVQRIRRSASGEVTYLESQQGPLQADHFVISTGVTRNGLLRGTASDGLVHGVLGVWLQIPNLGPAIKNSIKIHRRGFLVEDINVTVSKDGKTGEDILILGGGYGYVGLDYPSPDSSEFQALFEELEEVANIYFPEAYRRAKKQGTLWPEGERKFCIRPFTCTGLGIFEDIPTASGGHLIITGGNNTGGFAQSPAISRAVYRAIVGEHDPIHVLFSPHRSKLIEEVQYSKATL